MMKSNSRDNLTHYFAVRKDFLVETTPLFANLGFCNQKLQVS